MVVALAHYTTTLMDSKKGSLTNRHQCAVEHWKNDLKMELGLGACAGAAYGIAKSPKTTNAIAKAIGTPIAKLIDKSSALKNMLGSIAKNPTKLGKLGLLSLGAGIFTGLVANYANKAGRINQKYEDAAKIESQTKNVVLDNSSKKADQNYAEMAV